MEPFSENAVTREAEGLLVDYSYVKHMLIEKKCVNFCCQPEDLEEVLRQKLEMVRNGLEAVFPGHQMEMGMIVTSWDDWEERRQVCTIEVLDPLGDHAFYIGTVAQLSTRAGVFFAHEGEIQVSLGVLREAVENGETVHYMDFW